MKKQKVMQTFLPVIVFICCVITAISTTTVLGEEVKPAHSRDEGFGEGEDIEAKLGEVCDDRT